MLKWIKQLTLRRRQHEAVAVSPVVWVFGAVLEQTVEVLQRSGTVAETHEGVAYWAGRRFGADLIVTTCIAPAATTTCGSFETSSYTNARVVAYLAGAELELLGQVTAIPDLLWAIPLATTNERSCRTKASSPSLFRTMDDAV